MDSENKTNQPPYGGDFLKSVGLGPICDNDMMVWVVFSGDYAL